MTQLTDANGIPYPRPLNNTSKPVDLQPHHMMKLWRERPLIFFKDVLDITPDPWQADAVELYSKKQRVGLVASKGVGKTLLLAALCQHFFITRYRSKIAVLSVTKDHLKSNLWAELLRLREQSQLLKLSTNDGMERITMKGHEGYNFIDARSFPKQADETQMSSALAGLHADNVAFFIDEAGTIPDAIINTADAALSTGDTDTKCARLICAGNPEIPKGVIYRASMGKTEQDWGIYHVSGDPDDPKRAPRVSVKWAREQIASSMGGREDPWVMINVLGKYPLTAMNSLISEQEVMDAMSRKIDDNLIKNSQHRMGVDVSRGGADSTVFFRRQGLKAFPLEERPSSELGPQLAGRIALICQDQKVERVFVDDTGGYGSSVVDSLGVFSYQTIDVTPIKYNARAQDQQRYNNCRTEMWCRMRDWIKKGGCLPYDKKLLEEISEPRILTHMGISRLEAKEEIKKRLGRSPDRADALAQTFADVESMSFFADYTQDGRKLDDLSHEEIIAEHYRRKQGNYISDESQIDKYYNPPSNYKV
jgi:phage terminase large subunit